MMPRLSRPIAVVLLATSLGCAGCKSWNWLGDGFKDDLATTGTKLRPDSQDDGSQSMGLSAKSRQIERNLGVR